MEAAAECVPPGRVCTALCLRFLPPAWLCRPHLLRAQHPQEALSPGCSHRRRDGRIQANRGELRHLLQVTCSKTITQRKMSFFMRLDFLKKKKKKICHKDVEGNNLFNKLQYLGWTTAIAKPRRPFEKSYYSTVDVLFWFKVNVFNPISI